MTRVCTKCGIEKDLILGYSKYKRNKQGRCTACKDCCCKYKNAWYINNRDKILLENNNDEYRKRSGLRRMANPKRFRSYDLMRHYGINQEQYLEILESQNGVCAICLKFQEHKTHQYKNMHVDHNHVTGVNRGILCSNCNTGLGLFKEDLEVFKRVVKYLEKNN